MANDKQTKYNPTLIPFLSNNDKHIIDIKSCYWYGYSVALDNNGNVYAAGTYSKTVFAKNKDKPDDYYQSWHKVDSLSNQNIVQMDVGYGGGYGYSLFVTNNGDVWSCGENTCGELGLGFVSKNQWDVAQQSCLLVFLKKICHIQH